MSTRKLSRTVIEPGRTAFMKAERKFLNGAERTAARRFGRALVRDPDRDARASFPRRRPLHVSQHDKLAPLERWLRKQKDRPWSEVYSEIKARCDVRTTPGRHILYDHLLRNVEGNGISAEYPKRGRSEWRERFYVDDAGILRHVPATKRPRHVCAGCDPRIVLAAAGSLRSVAAACADPTRHAAATFVAGRRVRELGDALFWMVRVAACGLCGVPCAHLRYRQDRRLDEAEVAEWLTFGVHARAENGWNAPGSG